MTKVRGRFSDSEKSSLPSQALFDINQEAAAAAGKGAAAADVVFRRKGIVVFCITARGVHSASLWKSEQIVNPETGGQVPVTTPLDGMTYSSPYPFMAGHRNQMRHQAGYNR